MSKKFECEECGRIFPPELIALIEKKVQVFCERCGTPFSLEGVKFKEAGYSLISLPKTKRITLKDKENSKLDEIIQGFNKFSFLPVLIVTILAFVYIAQIAFNPDNWVKILIGQLGLGFYGLSILIYDLKYISPKIKEKKYNEIMLDSFCWGILGCILFGAGVIILIKGVLIFIYVVIGQENKDLKAYDIGLYMKNSFNQFSAIAGFVILILAVSGAIIGLIWLPLDQFIVFLCISSGALTIDLARRTSLKEKDKLLVPDFFLALLLGILGVMFAAAGIFILLKGVLILFLLPGNPTPKQIPQKIEVEKKESASEVAPAPIIKKEITKEPLIENKKIEEKEAKKEPIQQIPPSKLPVEPKLTKKEKARELENKEKALKIHESLLPVKDEKDKKVVKEYLTKIFAVLSKDMREQIKDLKISKEEKKELIKELAFLTKEEQIKYLDAINSIYQEIPKKLVERIKRLPNVKPKHYDKIMAQLKDMDIDEQIRFVEYLEEHA